MAKIPLRAYLKEIEATIERGEIDQAIAHARNIIRSYPKQIDAYRLLGKAFLESQRYTEASDILQRVLSVIPDDFVSHIGMSIIREDEGNLDAAIWHMERAYEVQPFNPAVQDELRRLYGRRDGIEPPKIRLTRGALVRMYMRGELYPQAIAETRAALADDPQRYDLLVLLARLYILSNQKFEATEVCSTLIGKLPFCMEANQILTEVLPGTSRAEDAKKFQQRIFALDPYAAFLSPSAQTSDQVPDQAVMIEQYVWDPADTESQAPDWTRTIGVNWEETEKEEELPDWINTLKVETPDAQPTTETGIDEEEPEIGPSDELVPDFMKDAGWTASDRPAEEIMAAEEEPDAVVPAEIPQWLQSMAPDQAEETETSETERTDWLEDILDQPDASANEAEPAITDQAEDLEAPALAGWLSEDESQPEGSLTSETSEQTEVLPGWTVEEEKSENVEEGAQEWASGLGIQDTPTLDEADQIPDWLKQMESEPENEKLDEQATPDWTAEFDQQLASDEKPADQTITDWMAEFEQASPDEGNSVESSILDSAAELEQQPSDEGKTTEQQEVPDWLAGLDQQSMDEETSAVETSVQPVDQLSSGSSEEADQEMEDAMAWLGTFSAAEEPSSVESTDETGQTVEKTMDWGLEEFPSAVPEAPVDETSPAESDQINVPGEEKAPDWLPNIGEESSQAGGEIPVVSDWMQEPAEEALPSLEPTSTEESETAEAAEPTPTINFDDSDAAMAWLESLAARQGADEATLITSPEQRMETPPEWVTREMETSGAVDDSTAGLETFPEATPSVEGPQVFTPEVEVSDQPSEELNIPVSEADSIELLEEPAGEVLAESPTYEDVSLQEPLTQAESELTMSEPVEDIIETTMETPAADIQQPEAAQPDLADMDAAMAWLEALAARQGADEATLTTRPEDRLETPPEWVKQEIDAESLVESAAPEPELATQESESAIPDWLEEGIETDEELAIEKQTVIGDSAPLEPEGELEIAEISAEQAPGELELADVEEEFAPTQDLETPISAPERETTMPEWLQQSEEEEAAELDTGLWQTEEQPSEQPSEISAVQSDEILDWLGDQGQENQFAETPITDAGETAPDWLSAIADEDTGSFPGETEPVVPESEFQMAWQVETAPEPEIEQAAVSAQAPEGETISFTQLQEALQRGEIDPALAGFDQMIQKGENVVEIILALRDALYRFPVDITIWQALGDAYSRNNQLQEALDAYTKAEELLR